MSLLRAALTLIILGPGILAPADALVLERVEVRRVWNGWGLCEFVGPGTVRVAVEDCGLLGYRGMLVVEETGIFPAYVVDCQQPEHEPLAARGLIADVSARELGHKGAMLILWK